MKYEDVVCFAQGPISASFCAPKEMPQADVEMAANTIIPTGISSRWAKAKDSFESGQANPCPCDGDPSRLHWLMHC